jgi:hypothetical protein
MITKDWIGKQLDKDLIGDGSIYSPDTCCFIPSRINTVIIGRRGDSKYLTGVNSRYGEKYYWFVNYNRKVFAKGWCYSELEAHKCWQTNKSIILRLCADEEYSNGNIDVNIRDALYRKADKILYERDNDLVTTKV